ncbi:hypothetical protein KFE25_005278 [Diacronema lutheri]|uniref:Uncharacterized protein n=2 Tax=Diacronema lutheri TaxID=2081491 RepID=A0A8J5XDN9_DIALT|nr:hypothetical protein KFE25_012945 [Diacronema lutheri]KAG8458851.1 hypothetical protein KFE25_005278 [Diacronema lutheri]
MCTQLWRVLALASVAGASGRVAQYARALPQLGRAPRIAQRSRALAAASSSSGDAIGAQREPFVSPVRDDGDGELGSAVESTARTGVANALYKFTRPHTIRGTILASFAGVARALIEHPSAISLQLVPQALRGLLALLLGNAFIVGINQIYDVEVDKINKPFLPIAAGEISPQVAWALVLGSLCGGLLTVRLCFSQLIFGLYALGLSIGGLYSLPPIQLKRFPIAAGLVISTVRGFLLNFGVYYAVREAIGVPFRWNPVVCFIATFMTVFASVIAVTKDLPDVVGDAAYKVKTFATRYGVRAVARGACSALGGAYAAATLLALLAPAGVFRRLPMAVGHAALGVKLLATYRRLDATSLGSIKRFYGGIWQIFYLQYALYPFI